jgi:hypothetical protein
MTSFFIAPFKPAEWETAKSDLKIDPEVYRQQLQEAFPGTKFYKTSGDFLLRWGLPTSMQGAHIFGGLHGDGQIVSIDTPYEAFFLWHRTVVPAKYKLFLFNASSTDCIELKPGATLDDIKSFIRGPS